ncbi:MAG: hypothetical protein J6Q22_08720 [Prevotella sp.]|nr:hypothetical protein [Prevotella sp.]
MNKLNDKDLREALRRHEAKRLKPQVSEDFCDKVMQALTETDTVSTEQPKRRRMWLYPAIGIAAAIVLLFSLNIALSHQDGEEPSLVAQTDTTRVIPQTETKKAEEHPLEEKGNKEMADTVKKVKEMIQMTKTPRHYMARQETKAESHAEPEVIDATDLAEQAITEEERRLEMEMMARMNGSLQADYQEMTREIRQRGERMTRQVEIAINDDKY